VSSNLVNTCSVRRRRHPGFRGGGLRTLRYPFDRCLACQNAFDPGVATHEAALTVYDPRCLVTIKFRVCQPCALNLDPRTNASRLLSRLVAWYTGALPSRRRHP
jgi:hypothetical protein